MCRAESSPLRMVIVDDQPDVRLLMRMIVESSGRNYAVVGEAADGAEAIELVGSVQPDCVILDLMMPGMDGVEAARQIRARTPDQKILFCSAHLDDTAAAAAAELRNEACLRKDDVTDLPAHLAQLFSA